VMTVHRANVAGGAAQQQTDNGKGKEEVSDDLADRAAHLFGEGE
jgi:hypothetical protein